jgi:hypothetical protein
MSRYYRSFLEESVITPSYPASLKLFIDAGNPLSYSGSGTTITDLIGTQNGTLTNGVGYSSDNGGYFTFDGVNDYIDFGINTAIQPTASRTVSLWVFMDSSTSLSVFFGDNNSATDRNGTLIWFDGNGYRSILCSGSSYQFLNFINTTRGVWYYLTLSFNGTTIKEYINGSLTNSAAQTIIPTNGINNTLIGKNSDNSLFLKGKVAQCKIYNTQLSDAEVLTDFNEFKGRYGY